MPRCKTCQESAAFHELINDLCHKCTARELENFRAALINVSEQLEKLSQRLDTFMPPIPTPCTLPCSPEELKQFIEDVRKLHTPDPE